MLLLTAVQNNHLLSNEKTTKHFCRVAKFSGLLRSLNDRLQCYGVWDVFGICPMSLQDLKIDHISTHVYDCPSDN